MRRRGLAAIVAAAVLALPATAAALDEYGHGDVVTDSFFVTGDTVTYADRAGSDGDGFVVTRLGENSTLRWGRLEGPRARERFHQYQDFGASEQRYAWGFAEYTSGGIDDQPEAFGFASGAAGSPATQPLIECGGDPDVPNVAVSGDAVAHQPAACSGRNLVVRDFAPGAAVPSRTIPLSASVAELRLAGRYVAYSLLPPSADATAPEMQIVVYDWVAGSEVYRARPSEGASFVGVPFDLQADGKVVVVTDGGEGVDGPDTCNDHYGVAWFSPAEPHAHVLPVKACVPDYRIESDRIAFFRSDGTGSGARLVVSDLSGGSVVSLARFKHRRTGQHFDIGANMAAFTAKGCVDHRIFRESLAPASESLFKVPFCRVRINSSAGRISRDGIASIRYTCPRGCNIYSRVQRPFSSAIKGARIARGRTGVIRFRVPASARARLQREGSLLLRVFAGIEDSTPVTVPRFAGYVRLRAR